MCLAHTLDPIADKTIAGNMPLMKKVRKKTLENEQHMFYPHTTSRAINNARAEANAKTKYVGGPRSGLQVGG